MKELQKSDGARKSKITGIPKLDDANHAGTKHSGKCTLIVTEGDSAKTLAVAGLSSWVGMSMGFSHFAVSVRMSEMFLWHNSHPTRSLTISRRFWVSNRVRTIRMFLNSDTDVLMIMTDADNDGSHIKGLILNMIHYFWPSLLKLTLW
jgi:Type IIA topoisomerase (DNA gyrase/topo II, topoisomerase IV), B subunit